MNQFKIVLAVALMSFLTCAAADPVAPNEVCLYEYINYVNKLGCFSLKPGMRQLLVPNLGKINDRASSIQVGENVEVVLFVDANFQNTWWFIDHLQESRPSYFEQEISSLIVAPRGQGIKGVGLYSGPGFLGIWGKKSFSLYQST